MPGLNIEIKIDGDVELVQRVRTALINREPLHKRLAEHHEGFTKEYVSNLDQHKTANRLGAKSTRHHKKAARSIESEADAEAATLRIPRATGLGRAFYDFELVPGAGKKFLTIPAMAETYGKRAGEFGQDAFRFVSFAKKHFALLWKDGPNKGKVAYWLKKKVKISQDRSLMPSEEVMIKLSRRMINSYVQDVAARP